MTCCPSSRTMTTVYSDSPCGPCQCCMGWLTGLAGLAGCLVEWRMRTTRTKEHDMLVICWACPVWVACEGSNAMHVAHGEGREDHQDSSNLRIIAIVPSSSSSSSSSGSSNSRTVKVKFKVAVTQVPKCSVAVAVAVVVAVAVALAASVYNNTI